MTSLRCSFLGENSTLLFDLLNIQPQKIRCASDSFGSHWEKNPLVNYSVLLFCEHQNRFRRQSDWTKK